MKPSLKHCDNFGAEASTVQSHPRSGGEHGERKTTDVRVVSCALYLLPVKARMPLKFGTETLTEVTCARVRVQVVDRRGRTAIGWGETPLSVQWTWPSALSYQERHDAMVRFCCELAKDWATCGIWGHAIEVGASFQNSILSRRTDAFNLRQAPEDKLPYLAALVCCSPFDIALHDAYGKLHEVPTYETYNSEFMTWDLSRYLTPAAQSSVDFRGKYPGEFLLAQPPRTLPVWHLVGGLDPLGPDDLHGSEPNDSYPVLLRDWIARDGLYCLKIKLRGHDAIWDYDRIVRVGRIALEAGCKWLTADFNCTVEDAAYVNDVLDRLAQEEQKLYKMLLYVEQPFPYELEEHRMDVHSVSSRKPLFMDESAHDWQLVKLGHSLGWTGVALKTCKTQTGAILSLCWAKSHGMDLMVQDLSNPMLAQIPHVLLAAHADTIMGVESNGMQFYPNASSLEAKVHAGLFKRRNGILDLTTISGPGFGYCLDKIARPLPDATIEF